MDKIIIIDFGGQYAHLVANRIRRLNVFSEIKEPDCNEKELMDPSVKGIILSGGPSSVTAKNAPLFNEKILSLGKPILGLCYGHQLIAYIMNGKVKPSEKKEYGIAELDFEKEKMESNPMLKGLQARETVWMSHGDSIEKLPENFEGFGSTPDCEFAVMANLKKKIFGFQFHPEVTHTENGMKMLGNFINICNAKKEWSMENFLENEIEEIKKKAGGKKVFLLASGGVDSTVLLALLNKALGSENVYALHIDSGFMRKNESKEIELALKKLNYSNFHVANAKEHFFRKLEGVSDPEEKRKIIGQAFIDVKIKEEEKLGLNAEEWILAQGTIYPDTIESGGTKHADTIKTHHNRVDAIQKLIEAGRIIEPIKDLYKDEVRELGLKLGLPNDIVQRHPFPGPGLAIRVLCAAHAELPSKKLLEKIEGNANLIAEKFGFAGKLLPIRSVGVQGDSRTYGHAFALFDLNEKNELSFDWKKLEKASTAITNNVKEINRVVYCVSNSVPNENQLPEFETHKETLKEERVKLLRECDYISMQAIEKNDLMEMVWQFPTILIPISFNFENINENKEEKNEEDTNFKESIVLRPIYSKEAMTARFADLPKEVVEEIVSGILKTEKISAVFYDVTHKPPGTIEWE